MIGSIFGIILIIGSITAWASRFIAPAIFFQLKNKPLPSDCLRLKKEKTIPYFLLIIMSLKVTILAKV